MKIIIITLLILQVLLSYMSVSKDSDLSSIKDILFTPFFLVGFPIFLGIFALFFNKKNIFDFVSKCTFFSISIPSIILLSMISYNVLLDGPLKEGALIFSVFPIYGFWVFIGSIILWTTIFIIKNKVKEKKYKTAITLIILLSLLVSFMSYKIYLFFF